MSRPGGGQSGIVINRAFEMLGIVEAMKPKAIFGTGGPDGLSGAFVARGEADLGVQQISELMAVPGIEIVGPLPGNLQVMTVFEAALSTSAKNNAGAEALMKYLATPAARAVMKTKGLEPG